MLGKHGGNSCVIFETTYAVGMPQQKKRPPANLFETTYAVGMRKDFSRADRHKFETTYAVGMQIPMFTNRCE